MKTLTIIFALTACLLISAQDVTHWRGPEGTGIYPDKKLLIEWPSSGPEMLWHYDELGEGHSSPAFANGKIYLTGMIDSTGYLFMLSQEGKLISKFPYGEEFTESYPGSRSTPVIAGDLLYAYSGLGKLVCMDAESGEIKWQKELFKDFDGSNIRWGVTETPVIHGNTVYCTPGGKTNNVVAFNRLSGELIWSSKGKGEVSAYCTPLLIELTGKTILVTMTANNIIAIDTDNGNMLWSHPHTNTWFVHPNTPLYSNGRLFCFSGYGQGAVMLKLDANGNKLEKDWSAKSFDSRIGGAVLVGGHIYGSGDEDRSWQCLDWVTGQQKYSSEDIAQGVVIYADGMLYCYGQRGELALVKADPSGFKISGKTKVELGSGQHWAHPVINDGRLFVRHGNVLIAYKIR